MREISLKKAPFPPNIKNVVDGSSPQETLQKSTCHQRQAAGAGRQFHRAAFSGRSLASVGGAAEAAALGGRGLQPLQLRRLGGAA